MEYKKTKNLIMSFFNINLQNRMIFVETPCNDGELRQLATDVQLYKIISTNEIKIAILT